MNILVLSVGTRNKVIQYIKKTLGSRGRVIATDMSITAPALYEADRYYQVPGIYENDYIKKILSICIKEEISAVLSLIDPELSILAKEKDRFSEYGVMIVGSSYELCEMSLDKYKMYCWLVEHGYKCAKSYISFDEFRKSGLRYPVFVKPIKGSASIAIAKADNEKMARYLYEQSEGMMLQEFLNGQEIGADVYVDMFSGEVVSIFAKRKILMRSGETDKAVSIKNEKLFSLIEGFVKEMGYRGEIDIDIFEVDGEFYISEVNPRFGGGYPHAYECGCDHVKLMINNVEGKINEKNIGFYDEGVYMMKYNDVMIKRL